MKTIFVIQDLRTKEYLTNPRWGIENFQSRISEASKYNSLEDAELRLKDAELRLSGYENAEEDDIFYNKIVEIKKYCTFQ